ncbi:saccharopine dehydrogenase C-terminal domain-containing protein [Nonlabens sp.]|uniref:saccharopine dehydrogenase family protein n=1 Tax=Nonlabens sp. TaxID=1888209 RepID=UPI0025D0CCB4|nr:saccharopine dehydrogenase C-terminal domain-containing protein [Nonlabens sp.]
MRHILIIGAGKSTGVLVDHLLSKSKEQHIQLIIADINLQSAQFLSKGHENATAVKLDIFEPEQRKLHIQKADLVISMLPARFHIEVARDCVAFNKNMVTASYVSPEMESLDQEVKEKGLIFMNEIGVDPGVDHMSAMKIIDRITSQGGNLLLFESFTGGLVAPEDDNNLWNYKFTWNPRNVVTAGQGGAAKFIQEGKYKYIPYHRLFRRTELLEIEGYGRFEALANRNSLKYREIYGLNDILTLYRGTMRRVGFSKAWNMFVQLGLTDDTYTLEGSENMTYRDFINSFLPYSPTDSVELKMRHELKIDQDDIMWLKLEELDIFNNKKKTGLKDATPAQMLQFILEDSWTLQPGEKDMIVMYHKFGYELNGEKKQIDSTMVCLGDGGLQTAMAKTVGLPVAIAALKILNGEFTEPGVQIPIKASVYQPILTELENHGIRFRESETEYLGYNKLQV